MSVCLSHTHKTDASLKYEAEDPSHEHALDVNFSQQVLLVLWCDCHLLHRHTLTTGNLCRHKHFSKCALADLVPVHVNLLARKQKHSRPANGILVSRNGGAQPSKSDRNQIQMSQNRKRWKTDLAGIILGNQVIQLQGALHFGQDDGRGESRLLAILELEHFKRGLRIGLQFVLRDA